MERERLRARVAELESALQQAREAEQEKARQSSLYSLAMCNARTAIWQWDMETGERYRSPFLSEILGYPEDAIPTLSVDVLSHPEDMPGMEQTYAAFLAGKTQEYEYEWRMLHSDGSWRWLLSRARAERFADGCARRVTGIFTEITERKRAEEERQHALNDLAESEMRLRAVGDNLAEGFIFRLVVRADGSRRFTYLSAGVEKLIGAARQAIYDDPNALYGAIEPEDVPEAIAREMAAGATMSRAELTLRYRNRQGSIGWLHLRKFPRASPEGGIIWDGVALDVTREKAVEAEREQLMRQVLKLANQDPLTQLLNHRSFYERLQTEEVAALQAGGPLTIAIVDLDSFKFFNDAYGHLLGDEVLIQVSRFLEAVCPQNAAIARVGGDEFALLLPGMDRAAADRWMDQLQQRTAELTFQPPDTSPPIPIRFSIGTAVLPDDGVTVSDVLYQADRRSLLNKGGEADADVARLRVALGETIQGFSMLESLVMAVDNKDRYTRRHSEDVVTFALALAAELGMSESEKDSLQLAALLHDVGKIGVPHRVLRHPGKLSPADYETVKRHPELSGVLISAVPELAHILDAVRHHHENWDGSGYPDGLQGEQIPFAARVLAVADAFSAMITDRPYRVGMSREIAINVLRNGSGKQWDPRCVEALIRSQSPLLSA